MTVPTEEENAIYLLKQRFREYIKSYFNTSYNIVSFEARQNSVPRTYYDRFKSSILLESERRIFTLKIAERIFFEEFQKL